MIELDQNQYGENGSEYIFQRRYIGEGRGECKLIEQLNRQGEQRVDNHDGYEQHDEARDDLLETLVDRYSAPLSLQGRQIEHGVPPSRIVHLEIGSIRTRSNISPAGGDAPQLSERATRPSRRRSRPRGRQAGLGPSNSRLRMPASR